jgi:ketosteroid isomerase-like protein
MPSTENQRFEQLDELFGLLVRGEYDEFLTGCSDDLVLNVRGSGGLATIVPRAQISEWHEATKQLAGGAFRSSVCFILAEEHERIVVLTHLIDRNGVTFRYETVNHCTLREDLLSVWFSYPMNVTDYARAWDLQKTIDPQLASQVHWVRR